MMNFKQFRIYWIQAIWLLQTALVFGVRVSLQPNDEEHAANHKAWQAQKDRDYDKQRQAARDKKTNELPTGVIVGIVIACIVAVLLIGLIIFFCLRKDTDIEDVSNGQNAVDDGFHVQSKPLLAKPPMPMQWEYVPPPQEPVMDVGPMRVQSRGPQTPVSPPPQPVQQATPRTQQMYRERGDRFSITGEDTVHVVHH